MADTTRRQQWASRVTLDLDYQDLALLELVARHEKLTKAETLRRLVRAEGRRLVAAEHNAAPTAG